MQSAEYMMRRALFRDWPPVPMAFRCAKENTLKNTQKISEISNRKASDRSSQLNLSSRSLNSVWTLVFFFEPSAVVPRSQRSQARGATSQPREFQHWRHAEGIFWVFEAAGSESVFWLQPDIDRSVSTPLWKELHLLLGGIPRDSKGLSCLRGKRGN